MPTKIPDIYHFNPTCEYAIANGTATWQPNLLLQKMETDLALLPAYLANPSDYLILDEKPSKKFINHLEKINVHIPHAITKNELENFQVPNAAINRLLPWGWSPAEHKFLTPLKRYSSNVFKHSPVFSWKPEYRNLYSKKFALEVLHKIISEIDSEKMIDIDNTARICTTKKEIEALLRKWNKLMIKAPLSSSGRGLQPITKVPVHFKVWEKILSTIRYQGYVLAEPLLDKAFDLAFQFELRNGKIKYLGQSNFLTDRKGQYQGNYLNGLPQNLNDQIKDFVSTVPESIIAPLVNVLEDSDLAIHYEGNFGVDMLIFRDENNNLKINPCLEINIRQTMGLLALQFEKYILPGTMGIYKTFYDPQKSFSEFVNEMGNIFPLIISNQKIKAGFFPLGDFNENTMFGAYLLVE